MKIEVLGPGCARCNTLASKVQETADKLGLDYEFCKVTNIAEIAQRGLMVTPALVIDGVVKLTGKVPSAGEIEALLQEAVR